MKTTDRKYALTAGSSIIIMAIAAAIAYGYIYTNLVVNDHPDLTFQNISLAGSMFKQGIAGWIIILITDVLVAWSLYLYLKSVNQKLALTTATIRMVYAGILAVAIYHLIAILPLTSTAGTTDSIVRMNSHLESFKSTWSFGLILFGLHLIGLGMLVYLSDFIPRIWAVLLIFSGLSYFGIHAAKFLFPEYIGQVEQIEMILSAPMAIGEVGFAVWLLIRGGKPLRTKTSVKAVAV
ncbi:DUF4386 domain-containing protein [Saccharicrinis sp. FJH54]|uniref:DUF4386 domain-containing protein n=1 Tax=Saccharicrinis sp. FJH54 TaxID=3344665 RepID=UPI0035D4BC44